jgi:hypothetical protein
VILLQWWLWKLRCCAMWHRVVWYKCNNSLQQRCGICTELYGVMSEGRVTAVCAFFFFRPISIQASVTVPLPPYTLSTFCLTLMTFLMAQANFEPIFSCINTLTILKPSYYSSYPPAYEDGRDRVFRNFGIKNSDAWELPRKKNIQHVLQVLLSWWR